MSIQSNQNWILTAFALGMLSQAAASQGNQSIGNQSRVPVQDVHRINCGGAQYLDPQGKTWNADFGFNTGQANSTVNPIAGTNADEIYQSDREDTVGLPELTYDLPVREGQQYGVVLHFAETAPGITGAGQRVFDVAVEGVTQIFNVDPFADAGIADSATTRTIQWVAADSNLEIRFIPIIGNPSIEAIHVYRTGLGVINQPPRITTSPRLSATEGHPYSYVVDSIDHTQGDSTSYSLVNAPLGATIHPVTGVLDWLPTLQVGLQYFTIRATDLAGEFDEQTFGVDTRYRINCGFSVDYTDTTGEVWSTDFGYNVGTIFATANSFSGAIDDKVYKSERNDALAAPNMVYSLNLDNGTYVARLHFAEAWPAYNAPGLRVFDVQVEGVPELVNFDVFNEAGGQFKAITRDIPVTVNDGVLDIEFLHVIARPKINAIEVFQPGQLDVSPPTLNWGHVTPGQVGDTLDITLSNTGATPLYINDLTYQMITGTAGHDFLVDFGGDTLIGDHQTVSIPVDVQIPAGESRIVPVTFSPTETVSTVLDLEFSGNFITQSVELSGIGGAGFGYLHVVIGAPDIVVDFDGNGSEDVALSGLDSHTHEPGESITTFDWEESGNTFSTQSQLTHNFPLGQHSIKLTIGDSAQPQKFLADTHTMEVVPLNQIPGVLALTYDAQGADPLTLLNNLPAQPVYAEQFSSFLVEQSGSTTAGVVVRLLANVNIQTTDNYEFSLNHGGPGTHLFIDNVLTVGQVMLSAGNHSIDARYAVTSDLELPIDLLMAEGNGTALPIDTGLVRHDFSGFPPVANNLYPDTGSPSGGNLVTLVGLGFFTTDQVTVQWGGTLIPNNQLTVTSTSIQLTTPPGMGSVAVTVNTPQGSSQAKLFDYDASGPLPIDFSLRTLVANMPQATTGAWGPDGKFYVGALDGRIYALTIDDDNQVTNSTVINTINALPNNFILGIAFNPFDPPSPVKIYVGHSILYADGGGCLTGAPLDYFSEVTVLEGPNFLATPLVTGLPASNHDHAVNGLAFDRNGDLYMNVGGNTNAGLVDCALGDLPPSPLSAATLKAKISKPGFNGTVTYVERGSALANNDQASGDIVEVSPGVDVTVFAAGQRNPFDLVYTTWDMIYATENGPNNGFGASTIAGCQNSMLQPTTADELNLLEFGQYYGHPNCNRAIESPRESVWHGLNEVEQIGEFTQAISSFISSVDGISEYRANTFAGAMRGNLIAQKYASTTFRVELSDDKRTVINNSPIPGVILSSLDVTTGPGGTLLGVDYNNGRIVIAEPNDPGATGLLVYDIFPWRAPAVGGHPFVIGGNQFGSVLGNVSVSIGGLNATLTSVSNTRIHGIIPAHQGGDTSMQDVVVIVGANSKPLEKAFRFLQPAGSEPWGWSQSAPVPVALGEVAAGFVNDKLYLVGEGDAGTYEYDPLLDSWASKSPRPVPGNHHALVELNGLLYFIGGLDAGSEGLVQIYNPALDSWSTGAPMPWAAGSCSAVEVNGLIYVFGGIVGGNTVNTMAAYDPQANSWSALLAGMPVGRNHAAAASDGTLIYVFGGRDGDNVPGNGFDETQVYNPATNTWETSVGGTLLPLPQARGGMGAAVYLNGEFYVLGGETLTGPGASTNDVYHRVDIYDPILNSWRIGAPMPTARHGIYPALRGTEIFVAGGGTVAGNSQSTGLEVYAP